MQQKIHIYNETHLEQQYPNLHTYPPDIILKTINHYLNQKQPNSHILISNTYTQKLTNQHTHNPQQTQLNI